MLVMKYTAELQISKTQLRLLPGIHCSLPKKYLYKGTWKRDADLQSVREELLLWMQITASAHSKGESLKKKSMTLCQKKA